MNIPAMSLQATLPLVSQPDPRKIEGGSGSGTTLPFTVHSHIELCYSNYHYKSILPAEKGTQLLPPVIIPRCSDTVITIDW